MLTQMILEGRGKGLEENSKRLEKKWFSACKMYSGAFYLNLLFVEFWVDGPLRRKPSITCAYSPSSASMYSTLTRVEVQFTKLVCLR